MGFETGHQVIYAVITVRGFVDRPLPGWSDYIRLFKQDEDRFMLLGQFVDQSALRGFVEHLWNLNFTICSIENLDE